MDDQFDASGVWDGAISDEAIADHRKKVEGWLMWPSALSNAKLHAERELDRLVKACNRIAWGAVPSTLRRPSPAESEALLGRLGADDREKLIREARHAAEQRGLLEKIAEAEAHYFLQLEAERIALSEEEARNQEWAEFEAYDAAGQQQRFEAWRASRK